MGTGIQWTEETWNPITGCEKVSPGCAHCYAEGVAERFWDTQYAKVPDGKGGTRFRVFTDVQTHDDRLRVPLGWKRPRRVFVNSMSDLFHESVSDHFIARVFAVMSLASRHTFQVLTKRAARMQQLLSDPAFQQTVTQCRALTTPREPVSAFVWPLPNVWIGVSVENQHFADERIPLLLQTTAAVRFLSAEPLLGGIDIAKHRPGALGLHWVIIGGESGPQARPCEVWWITNLIGQCRDAGVAVFVKQLGAKPLVTPGRLRHWEWGGEIDRQAKFAATDPLHESLAPWGAVLKDRKGGDMDEWPVNLRVREYPQSVGVA